MTDQKKQQLSRYGHGAHRAEQQRAAFQRPLAIDGLTHVAAKSKPRDLSEATPSNPVSTGITEKKPARKLPRRLPRTRFRKILASRKFKKYASLASLLIVALLVIWWALPSKAFGNNTQMMQQINLVDCPGSATIAIACTNATSTDAPTNGELGKLKWDPTVYGGQIQVFFEAVLSTSVGTNAATATLYDQATGTAISGSAVSTSGDTSFHRVRSGDISGNLITGDHMSVRIKNASTSTTTLKAARLIIQQNFTGGPITETATSIDIGNNTTSTATTATDINDQKIFKYDASKYDGAVAIYLEATIWNTATNTTSIFLQDNTTGLQTLMTSVVSGGGCTVPTNGICNKGTTPTYVKGSFPAGLADGHEYNLQMLGSSATTGKISMARLVIWQRPTIDQSSLDESSTAIVDGSTTKNARAQSFSVSKSGYYTGFSVGLGKVGTPTDSLRLTLRDGLDGNVLGNDFRINGGSLVTTTFSHDFFFSQPVWLTSSNTYYIQADRPDSNNTSNYFLMENSTVQDTYPGGAAYLKTTSWGAAQNFDLYFAVFAQLPTKMELYHEQVASIATDNDSTYTAQNYLNQFDPSTWVNIKNTYYFETTIKATAGSFFANTRDVDTPVDISGSEVTTTGTTYTRQRSGDISANMPASAKQMDTQLKNSAASGNTTSASVSWIIIDVNAGPSITSVVPNIGPTASGMPFTLYGTGFRPGATVTIGGSSATSVNVVSAKQINALAPSGSAGTADLVVTNTDGTTETYKKAYTFDSSIGALTKSNNGTTSTGFNTTGRTLTNTNTSGVINDASDFQWLDSTPSTTGGSLATASYFYVVTAFDGNGNESTKGPQTRSISVTGPTGSISLGWRPIPGATKYKVYRTTTSGTYGATSLDRTITDGPTTDANGVDSGASGANSEITMTDYRASLASGAPPASYATTAGIGLSYGTVPNSGSGTFTVGTDIPVGIGAQPIPIHRPDGTYLVTGQGKATEIYNPTTDSYSNGPLMTCDLYGGFELKRPDGKFLFGCGQSLKTTTLYDPIANTFVAGPSTTGNVDYGVGTVKRPDGRFFIPHGGDLTTSSIYDPNANTMVAGPTSSGTWWNPGTFGIKRPDGTFLIAADYSNGTDIYDPNANTTAVGPTQATVGMYFYDWAIQRPNGTYLVMNNTNNTTTQIYDPFTNTLVAGPSTGSNNYWGSSPFQRPDGKWEIPLGGSATPTVTKIYDPVANTMSAGPATNNNSSGSGQVLSQRPDGTYTYIESLSGTVTKTDIYDAGWVMGTSAGQYESEAINITGNTTWKNLSWQDNGKGALVEVRTATTSGGLASATYQSVSNGGSVNPGTGEIYAQVRVTFNRTVPQFDNTNGGNEDSWNREQAFTNRQFDIPMLQSLTLSYNNLQATSITPNKGPTAGGTPFTITGTAFDTNATVTIGGASATNVFTVNSTTITGISPSGTGAANVVVTNPDSGVTSTIASGFTYVNTFPAGFNSYAQLSKTLSTDFSPGTLTSAMSNGPISLSNGAWQWLDYTDVDGGGGIAAGTYYYEVTATDFDGHETTASAETPAITATSSDAITLTWRPIAGATGYNIYRTTSSGTYSGTNFIASISTSGASTSNTSIAYTDTAASPTSGAPPGSNTTTGELTLSRSTTIPNSFAAGNTVVGTSANTVGLGSLSIKRPDGKFLVVQGNGQSDTSMYDPSTNTFTAGPAVVGTYTNVVFAGSTAIQRPDGKYLIVLGNSAPSTTIYDPSCSASSPFTGCFTAGPAVVGTTTSQPYSGAHAIKRPDGTFLLFIGNQNASTSIYDPVANTFSAGPPVVGTASNLVYAGANSIPRPDGTFLLVLGNSTADTSIYDPVANSFSAGPTMGSATGGDALTIQRPNGTYIILLGGGTGTVIYNPAANTFSAGPSVGATFNGGTAVQRPDGQFLVTEGGNTTATRLYDPVANSFAAGPTISGGVSWNGTHAFQRTDGKYLFLSGGALSSTSIYDAGWNIGSGLTGTYTSEALNPTEISSWDLISWVKTIDNNIQASDGTVDNIEVRTATTSALLSSATYRKVANGASIGAGANEVWLQFKVTFQRSVPGWSGTERAGADAWTGLDSVIESRSFATPDLQSITATYNVLAAPAAPVLNSPADTSTNVSRTPALQFRAADPNNSYLRYAVIICSANDANCFYDGTSSGSSVLQTNVEPTGTPQTGWTGQDQQSSTAYTGSSTITSSTMATFTVQTALNFNTTYYWKAYARDPGDTNTWSPGSSTFSFTTNQTPAAPTLLTPGDGSGSIPQLPTFTLKTTDPDSDYLRYVVIICNASTNCTWNGTTYGTAVVQHGNQVNDGQTGWSGQDQQASTAYTGSSTLSGSTTGTYQAQSLLTVNTTYYWRAYAIDPAGTNTWSSASSIYSFTVSPPAVILKGNTKVLGNTTLKP